jgi:vacuolar-type H+-ATPase subunit H
METGKTKTATSEAGKTVENAFNNVNATMTDMYKKQMDMATSFYNNLFKSSLGNTTGGNQYGGFPNMFANMDMTKWFSNPFANFSATGMQNPFSSPFEKAMKQMTEFNQNLLSAFTNGISGKGNNMGAMSEEYKEAIATRMEASKEILATISEGFQKQLESSMQNNKKTMEEISNQFGLVMKQNQKLWADILKMWQGSVNEAEKTKDAIVNEAKKRSNVLVNEFTDHKGK